MEPLSGQPAWSQCTALMPGVGNCSSGTSRYSDGTLHPGVPALDGGCRGTELLLALVPCGVPSGGTALEQGAGMGQVRQGPVFRAAQMLGSPPALALCQSCSGAVGTAPLQSPGKGRASAALLLPRVGSQGFRETPGAGWGFLLFSVKFCTWESLFGEGRDWRARPGSRAPHLPGSGCRAVLCPAPLAMPCKQRCPALGWQRLEGSLGLW